MLLKVRKVSIKGLQKVEVWTKRKTQGAIVLVFNSDY